MPIASPAPSQKIQLPDNMNANAPTIIPRIRPATEIFFITFSLPAPSSHFIAVHALILSTWVIPSERHREFSRSP
jgi:hypothetical protein